MNCATLMIPKGASGDTGVLYCFIVLGNTGFKRKKNVVSGALVPALCSIYSIHIYYTLASFIYSPASVSVQLTAASLALLFAQLDVWDRMSSPLQR